MCHWMVDELLMHHSPTVRHVYTSPSFSAECENDQLASRDWIPRDAARKPLHCVRGLGARASLRVLSKTPSEWRKPVVYVPPATSEQDVVPR